MAIVLIENKEEYTRSWVKNDLNFMQSWQWGEVKSPAWRAVRISINNYPVTIFTKQIPVIHKSFGYIPRALGRLSLEDDFYEKLSNFAKNELKLTHLIIECDSTSDEKLNQLLKLKWKKNGHTIQPQNTNIIDLKHGEDQVLSKMS